MNNIRLNEIETTFTICGEDRSVVRVFSNDAVWIRRIEKLMDDGIVCDKTDEYGKYFTMSDKNLTIRKKRRLTEKQKFELSERAKNNFC